jgi:hypothetical protein
MKNASVGLGCGPTRELPFEMQKGTVNLPAEGRVYRNASLVVGALKSARIRGQLAWMVV